MSYVKRLQELCSEYVRQYGHVLQMKCAVIVSTDAGVGLMRELMFKPHPKVTFDGDDDTLFLLDRVPVHLRHNAPPGNAIIVERQNVPASKCCDHTAMQTMMIVMHRGQA